MVAVRCDCVSAGWFPGGFRVVSGWFPGGFRVVSRWFPGALLVAAGGLRRAAGVRCACVSVGRCGGGWRGAARDQFGIPIWVHNERDLRLN